MIAINNDWDQLLRDQFCRPYYLALQNFLREQYTNQTVFPASKDLYQALRLTPYQKAKVVILGQDPYHGEGQAHGLAFSVPKGVAVPPSLRNIYHELHQDLGCYIPNHGYLVSWAQQGILLLNTCLSVQANIPNSHRGKGWEVFTDRIIQLLCEKESPVIFLLFGNNAKAKAKYVFSKNHLVLTAPHPSPLSAHRGFFGCKHFSQSNEFFCRHGLPVVDWQIHSI